MKKETIYEEGGELRTERLWVCRGCGRAWSADKPANPGFDPKDAAARCCAKDLPCTTEGCVGRARSPYHACDGCKDLAEEARWEKRERRPWDGKTPVYSHRLERYFFHGEWEEGLEDLPEGSTIENLRLVICRENEPPVFELLEHVRDVLPDEEHGGGDGLPGDPAEVDQIEKVVNDWLEKHRPFSWEPGKYALDHTAAVVEASS